MAAPSVAMVPGAWCCAKKSQSAGGPGRVLLRDNTVGMAEGRQPGASQHLQAASSGRVAGSTQGQYPQTARLGLDPRNMAGLAVKKPPD